MSRNTKKWHEKKQEKEVVTNIIDYKRSGGRSVKGIKITIQLPGTDLNLDKAKKHQFLVFFRLALAMMDSNGRIRDIYEVKVGDLSSQL